MNEAEALEVVASFQANAISSFTVYLSLTFAYLTASYLAASKLSKYQILFISILYTVAATSTILSLVLSVMATEVMDFPNGNPLHEIPMWSTNGWMLAMSTILTLGIIGSLYFTYTVRRAK